MSRIAFTDGPTTRWFDPTRAHDYPGATEWNSSYNVDRNTRDRERGERVWRTAMGRWVLEQWSTAPGERPSLSAISDKQASDWLRLNNHDAAILQHLAHLDTARPPGRRAIGGAAHVRLGELITSLDAWANDHNLNRADATRLAVQRLLTARDDDAPPGWRPGLSHPTLRALIDGTHVPPREMPQSVAEIIGRQVKAALLHLNEAIRLAADAGIDVIGPGVDTQAPEYALAALFVGPTDLCQELDAWAINNVARNGGTRDVYRGTQRWCHRPGGTLPAGPAHATT